MICPKCGIEFGEDFTACSYCGSNLIESPKERIEIPKKSEEYHKTKNWLNSFGEITAQKGITILFYLGLFPLLYSSILFGNYILLGYEYLRNISLGVVCFIFAILVWKIICELLIIIFRCFETYVQKNK